MRKDSPSKKVLKWLAPSHRAINLVTQRHLLLWFQSYSVIKLDETLMILRREPDNHQDSAWSGD